MQAVERRRWRRVNCDAGGRGVLLRLETQDPASAVLNTYARDVSLGGLSFEVNERIVLPDSLPLKLFLPHTHTPLNCSSEQRHTLKDFLREIGGQTATVEREPAEVQETEAPPPQRRSRRDQAIQQFEQGVLLYHQRKWGQAKRAFQKAIREYADITDVARVARRYHDWCEVEQGRGTGGIAHG